MPWVVVTTSKKLQFQTKYLRGLLHIYCNRLYHQQAVLYRLLMFFRTQPALCVNHIFLPVEFLTMNRSLAIGCLSVSLFILGCGPDLPSTIPVTGTITLDGKPVEGATVNFLSEEGSVTASGTTDASGKYSLKTFVGDQYVDGAVIGKHLVAVVKTESDGQTISDPKEFMANMASNPAITSEFKAKNLVPAKYNNPTMSQLKAEVTEAGPNDFPYELSSK